MGWDDDRGSESSYMYRWGRFWDGLDPRSCYVTRGISILSPHLRVASGESSPAQQQVRDPTITSRAKKLKNTSCSVLFRLRSFSLYRRTLQWSSTEANTFYPRHWGSITLGWRDRTTFYSMKAPVNSQARYGVS